VARWDAAWHARLDAEIINLPFLPQDDQAEIRRALGQDPVAFARLYLDHHLKGKETGDRITFSEIHYEWARLAESWKAIPSEPMANRHAVIAPRATGKSTWFYLILPLWAAAYGHCRFIAAFAHSTAQAEGHLQTFKHEIETNAWLRHDFPDLCSPARRHTGNTVADRAGMIHARSGFTFAARGVDAASLGLKVNERRPDLLITDDCEPDEANYSPEQAVKRLGTVTDSIFALNVYAHVVMVGTVTMPGSIMHQLVKAASGTEVAPWVAEERIQAHHHQPILVDDDGTERSAWPEKWPLEWLQSRRHTREYAKNYLNDPLAREGVYWLREDFRYGELEAGTRTVLAVDPAVTSKKTSDFTGLAVVTYDPIAKKCLIEHAIGVRLTGSALRDYVVKLLGTYPHIRRILVETNQGGELWPEVFHHLPNVKVVTHTSSKSKEIRFADALRHWQTGRVLHSRKISILEEQAVAFPKGTYDDVIDAAVAGVHYFIPPDWDRTTKARVRVESYV
jgi:phage terminase large subunit-like protein